MVEILDIFFVGNIWIDSLETLKLELGEISVDSQC